MKVLKTVGKWIGMIVKYEFFSFWLVYVGTRVANFLEDPYLADDDYTPWVWDDLAVMFVQSLAFLLLFVTTRAFYRLFFKKDYRVINIITAVFGFATILIGTILSI